MTIDIRVNVTDWHHADVTRREAYRAQMRAAARQLGATSRDRVRFVDATTGKEVGK